MNNEADFGAWENELGVTAVVRAMAGAAWDAFGPVIVVAAVIGTALLLTRSGAARGVATTAAEAAPSIPFGFHLS
jgi:hypothetical protein